MDLRITFFSFYQKNWFCFWVYSPMTTGTLGLMIPAFSKRWHQEYFQETGVI
jgi:hypothetical protein